MLMNVMMAMEDVKTLVTILMVALFAHVTLDINCTLTDFVQVCVYL